jgi:hypothetical protein
MRGNYFTREHKAETRVHRRRPERRKTPKPQNLWKTDMQALSPEFKSQSHQKKKKGQKQTWDPSVEPGCEYAEKKLLKICSRNPVGPHTHILSHPCVHLHTPALPGHCPCPTLGGSLITEALAQDTGHSWEQQTARSGNRSQACCWDREPPRTLSLPESHNAGSQAYVSRAEYWREEHSREAKSSKRKDAQR